MTRSFWDNIELIVRWLIGIVGFIVISETEFYFYTWRVSRLLTIIWLIGPEWFAATGIIELKIVWQLGLYFFYSDSRGWILLLYLRSAALTYDNMTDMILLTRSGIIELKIGWYLIRIVFFILISGNRILLLYPRSATLTYDNMTDWIWMTRSCRDYRVDSLIVN